MYSMYVLFYYLCIYIYIYIYPGVSFRGWANNQFNSLRFKNHVKQRTTIEMGRGRSLIVSQCSKRRLLK